jgi:hypothetical protein
MRFTTNALPDEVRDVAPEARRIERDHGLTTFLLDEQDDRGSKAALSELKRAGYTVYAGHPRVSYSSPRAFASVSAHIRRF